MGPRVYKLVSWGLKTLWQAVERSKATLLVLRVGESLLFSCSDDTVTFMKPWYVCDD
jgi:hypothetical protein